VDLGGLARACQAGFGRTLEVVCYLSRTSPVLEQGVDANTLRLGCTPMVNLFAQTAEPIPLTQARYEYRIVPDVAQPMGMEVYSVEGVLSVDPAAGVTTVCEPFYSFKHGAGPEQRRAFWYAVRRESTRESDHGTEVFLNLVDLDFDPRLPAASTLVVRTTGTNRDLAGHLQR